MDADLWADTRGGERVRFVLSRRIVGKSNYPAQKSSSVVFAILDQVAVPDTMSWRSFTLIALWANSRHEP